MTAQADHRTAPSCFEHVGLVYAGRAEDALSGGVEAHRCDLPVGPQHGQPR